MRFLAVATFLCFWVSVFFALFAVPARIPMLYVLVWGAGLVIALALRLPGVVFIGFQAGLTVLLLISMQGRRPEEE